MDCFWGNNGVINGLDLFSGIGGLSVALSEWVRPIAYCEIDHYCKGVLLSRMVRKSLPIAPIWDDIQTLDGNQFRGKCDIIYGGFPCTDISIVKVGEGLEGKHSRLAYEIFRLAKDIRPTFIFMENVPAITTRGGVVLVQELTKIRYDCRWCVISAASIGAPHKRERWFLLAHSKGERPQEERQPLREEEGQPGFAMLPEHETGHKWTESPSPFVRVDDVLPFRLDRVRALGNSVCVVQAKEAFKILMGLK